MRILNKTGLVRVEASEWPVVLRLLRLAGYLYRGQGQGRSNLVWMPNGIRCVGQWDNVTRAYYLDECALIDLLEAGGATEAS